MLVLLQCPVGVRPQPASTRSVQKRTFKGSSLRTLAPFAGKAQRVNEKLGFRVDQDQIVGLCGDLDPSLCVGLSCFAFCDLGPR